MENNCFFGTVLRTLGFEVCSAGARVGRGEGGTGWRGGMVGGTWSIWLRWVEMGMGEEEVYA